MSDAAFDPTSFSLLFPHGENDGSVPLSASAVRDLRVNETVKFLAGNDLPRKAFFEKVLCRLPQNEAQIRARQDVLDDPLNTTGVAESIKRMLPHIDSLNSLKEIFSHSQHEKRSLLHSVSWRISILESYIACLDILGGIDDGKLVSKRLAALVGHARHLNTLSVTQNCRKEIPEMRKKIENVRSFSIGINLNASHNPAGVTLLSVNDRRYEKNGIVKKLFGDGDDPVTDTRIFSLYKNDNDYPLLEDVPGEAQVEILKNMNQAMRPLFDQISKLMRTSLEPLDAELRRYTMENTTFLCNLRQELDFYLMIHELFCSFRNQGLPVCKPVICGKESRTLKVKDGYSLNLVLRNGALDEAKRGPIVTNDILIDDDNRIGIVTGPNQGGKTTFLETVGLIQIFAQAGLFVPGREAQVSICDAVFTHYQEDEKPDTKLGRFGEEAVRLKAIMDAVTPHSFVFLNESFSSTHAGEAFYIAKDIISVLRQVGASVLFSTHLHSLAEQAEAMNAEPGVRGKVVSLVSEVDESGSGVSALRRTFRIVKSQPKGKSYATDIAKHYGIDYGSMISSLEKRRFLREQG